jgi:hypothetical protein
LDDYKELYIIESENLLKNKDDLKYYILTKILEVTQNIKDKKIFLMVL